MGKSKEQLLGVYMFRTVLDMLYIFLYGINIFNLHNYTQEIINIMLIIHLI